MLLLVAVSGVQVYHGDGKSGEYIVICFEVSNCHLFRGEETGVLPSPPPGGESNILVIQYKFGTG
jgi:hypothetical protein